MNEATETEAADSIVRVRVWFGRFPIVDYTTCNSSAHTQALGLDRRFAGLPVTVEPYDVIAIGIAGAIR
ncbi:hypothetical protein [Kribbella sp. NBC_00359]|uniref:hypothetical protein n=1 Tax=Kribbella sp. NBC_00359 TaxID=2975966 RepID=UPI002E1C7FEF